MAYLNKRDQPTEWNKLQLMWRKTLLPQLPVSRLTKIKTMPSMFLRIPTTNLSRSLPVPPSRPNERDLITNSYRGHRGNRGHHGRRILRVEGSKWVSKCLLPWTPVRDSEISRLSRMIWGHKHCIAMPCKSRRALNRSLKQERTTGLILSSCQKFKIKKAHLPFMMNIMTTYLKTIILTLVPSHHPSWVSLIKLFNSFMTIRNHPSLT